MATDVGTNSPTAAQSSPSAKKDGLTKTNFAVRRPKENKINVP